MSIDGCGKENTGNFQFDPNPLKVGIVIGIPFCGRAVTPEWAMALRIMDYPLNVSVMYVGIRGQEVGSARNDIAEQALKIGAKYLFFLDDDVACPPYALRKLMATLGQRTEPLGNVMVAAGIYSSKTFPSEPLVYQKDGAGAFWQWKRGDIFDCASLGTGCMLINTEIFKRLDKPWFKTVDDPLLDGFEGESRVFQRHMSDDIYFCQKVKQAGYGIVADAGVLCMHWDVGTGKYFVLDENSYPLQTDEKKPKIEDTIIPRDRTKEAAVLG